MKITGFRPLIVTKNSEELIKLFEELGFERRHTKTGIKEDITSVAMGYGDDFRVNIAQVDHFSKDFTAIAINVDNFDEAYEFLKAKGFTNAQGDKVVDTGSSRATLMVSPSGFAINLAQHIK